MSKSLSLAYRIKRRRKKSIRKKKCLSAIFAAIRKPKSDFIKCKMLDRCRDFSQPSCPTHVKTNKFLQSSKIFSTSQYRSETEQAKEPDFSRFVKKTVKNKSKYFQNVGKGKDENRKPSTSSIQGQKQEELAAKPRILIYSIKY